MERSNLGFLRTLTFLMRTFSSGKILEHSWVMVLPMVSFVLEKNIIKNNTKRERKQTYNFLKSSLRLDFWHSFTMISIIFWRISFCCEFFA